jgi:hypothetical protein
MSAEVPSLGYSPGGSFVISCKAGRSGILPARMPLKPESGSLQTSEVTIPGQTPRPFRVKLRGSILALLRMPNRRLVRGKLHQISTTGGLLNVEKPLDEKLRLELIFHLRETTIRETVEMMFPMWATQGWLQPFRFIDMPEANRKVLDLNLRELMQPSDAKLEREDSSPQSQPVVREFTN